MASKLLNRVGYSILKRKIGKAELGEIENSFISNSVDFAFLMPENFNEFEDALEIAKYFKIHKKNCTLFLFETSYSRVGDEYFNLVPYNKLDTNKFGLPGKVTMEKIRNRDFDVLINFNREADLFTLGMIANINAKYKIGFWNNKLENFYNFSIKTEERISEISYRKLLNSLQMF
ncbi:MAG: hypothetical protein D6830_04140 [Ignavibacteria bacterium]|nr:MAG: hypothetical protein D6830_04140 [Ignavibacteria bacterium]